MEQHTDVWADCMSFMYTHNYFHLALFQLAVGDLPAVEHTFKRHIWGGPEQRAPSDDKYPVAFVAQARGGSLGSDARCNAPDRTRRTPRTRWRLLASYGSTSFTAGAASQTSGSRCLQNAAHA
jgi:hypothetical protein